MTSNVLKDQVLSLGDLIREQTWRLEDELRKAIPTPIQHSARHVVLTGCGDSAIAGRGAEFTFRSIAGLPALAAEAMEASRYVIPNYANQYPHTPLVFAVSNSGEVSRVVEAASRARAVGGYVVGLTGNNASRLAQNSDVTVDVSSPAFPPAPGVRSYVMALLALNLFAIRLAEVRGRITMDEAQELRTELSGLGVIVQQYAEAIADGIEAAASEWAPFMGFEFLGSGPSRASAAYGSAKILEAVGAHSTSVDLEEFVHLNYFVRDAARTGTVVVSGNGQATHSRALEVAKFLHTLKRPWIAIGDVPGATHTFPPPEGVREAFLPIVHTAPLALLAGGLMVATREEPGRGGVGQWADCAQGGTTTTSAIEGIH